MNIQKTQQLNDKLRKSFSGGKVLITRGVADLDIEEQLQIIRLVQNFNQFTPDNDPYGEHDFGAIEFQGNVYFWKVDYYDLDYQYLSPDPSDSSVTNRVLTIMNAGEY